MGPLLFVIDMKQNNTLRYSKVYKKRTRRVPIYYNTLLSIYQVETPERPINAYIGRQGIESKAFLMSKKMVSIH